MTRALALLALIAVLVAWLRREPEAVTMLCDDDWATDPYPTAILRGRGGR